MGGFFGTVKKSSCITDLSYGTDYNSHLGTRRGGMATYDATEKKFNPAIHNLESCYFRTKFESGLDKFTGNSGIGIISDTDPQPIIFNSHLGKFAIVTVAKIANINELEKELLDAKILFDCGAKEVHMRIACPPLVHGCKYINFSSSKTDLELFTRKVIKSLSKRLHFIHLENTDLPTFIRQNVMFLSINV